jgi:phosphonate transport system substrate-binding protein
MVSATPVRSSPELVFGLTPVFLTSDIDLLEKLKAYLDMAVGRPVRLVTKRTYQEITALLISGQLDAAWICGYPFVAFRRQLDLVAVPVWRGRPLYQSYLIADRDRSEANGIDDLEGDVHAFSDPDSNSGFLVTRAMLAERHRAPDNFFRKSFFTYGHRNVVRAVASGLAASGSVDGYVWDVMAESEPDLTGKTRVVSRSELLGFPPVAALRDKVSSEPILALRRALLEMHLSRPGQSVLNMLRLDGFTIADPSIFDGIAAKMELVRSSA